jgi:hypothetical protein
MEGTPTLMWSTQRLVSKDLDAPAVPGERLLPCRRRAAGRHPDPDAMRSALVR